MVQDHQKEDHCVFASFPSGQFITTATFAKDEKKGGKEHSAFVMDIARKTDSLDTMRAMLWDGTGTVIPIS